MSAKTVFPSALLLTALSLCTARGQSPAQKGQPELLPGPKGVPGTAAPLMPAPALPSPGAAAQTPPDGPAPSALPAGPASPSAWITGANRAGNCCGPLGGDGPVQTELFLRTGPAFNLGGSG